LPPDCLAARLVWNYCKLAVAIILAMSSLLWRQLSVSSAETLKNMSFSKNNQKQFM